MNTIGKQKFNLSLLNIFIIICIIWNSGYTLAVASPQIAVSLLILMTVILMLKLFLNKTDIATEKLSSTLVLCLIMSFAFFASMVENLEFSYYREYIRNILLIVSAYCISQLITPKQFVFYFTKTMRVVAVVSLIMFAGIKYFNIGGYLPTISTNGYNLYYNAYVFFSLVTEEAGNAGIFWEVGLYAVFLSLSLVSEIMFFKNKFYIAIFLIALYTTSSTAAYLYAIMLVFLVVSKRGTLLRQLVAIVMIAFFATLVYINYDVIVNFLADWNPRLFEKIKLQNNSFTDRAINPIVDMKIMLEYPFFGCGVGRLTDLVVNISAGMGTKVNTRTSSLTYFFASLGLFGGIIYNYAWISGIIKTKGLTVLGKILLLVFFIMLASASPLNYNLTFWIIIFMLKRNNELYTEKACREGVNDNESAMAY